MPRCILPSAPPPAQRWEPLYSFPLFLSVSSISMTNLFFFLLGSGTEGDSSRLPCVPRSHALLALSLEYLTGSFLEMDRAPFFSSPSFPPAFPLASSSCFPFALLIYSHWKASRFHCVRWKKKNLLFRFFSSFFPCFFLIFGKEGNQKDRRDLR